MMHALYDATAFFAHCLCSSSVEPGANTKSLCESPDLPLGRMMCATAIPKGLRKLDRRWHGRGEIYSSRIRAKIRKRRSGSDTGASSTPAAEIKIAQRLS